MWRCPKCGETHEDVFDACWNCLAPREGELAPVSPLPREPEAPQAPVFRLPSLRWLGFVPRVVIAWVLVAPWVLLAWCEVRWDIPGASSSLIATCVVCAAIYVAGAIQRRDWLHFVTMMLLGAGMAVAMEGLAQVPLSGSLLWRILWPAVVIIPAAVAEWFFTCRGSRGALVGVLLAGLAAAAVCAMIQQPLAWVEWQVPCPDATGFGWGSCSAAALVLWPLPATLLWLAVPLGLAAGARRGLPAGIALAAVAAAILAAYVGFYGWGVYELGQRSLADQGPFPRRIGLQLVAHRGRPSDYEAIWQMFLERGDDAETVPPDWHDRAGCIDLLMEHAPEPYADRVVQLLRDSPNADLARLVAHHLAQRRAYEAAPMLARYAMHGEEPCIQALEEMGIPQAAMGLLARAELDWLADQRSRALVDPHAAFKPGENTLVSPEIRKRLAAVLGADAGPRVEDWIDLYDAKIARVPSPLSPAQRDEVDRVVACWRKNWEAVCRWWELRHALSFRYADLRMQEEGQGEQLETLKRRFSQALPGQPLPVPAENDPLFPVLCQWAEYYAEARDGIRIYGADWDVPTTQALEKEVEAFVRRVDNACAEFGGLLPPEPGATSPHHKRESD